jgi:hypothetical protein
MAALILGIEEQVIITFLFVLAVVFGALRISNVLKSGAASFILSMAVAAFAALYSPFTALLWSFMPSLTSFFIIIFLVAFVFEIFGIRKGEKQTTEGMVVNAAILLALMTVGWRVAQTFNVTIPFIGSAQNLIFLLGLIFIVSIFWSAMKGKQEPLPAGGR